MCIYSRNWQVTFILYILGVITTEYIAKAYIEPRDYRVVFLIQQTGASYPAPAVTIALRVAKHSLVTFLICEPRETHSITFSLKG